MQRSHAILIAIAVGITVVVAIAICVILAIGYVRDRAVALLLPPPGVMYPPAPAMPPPVSTPVEDLLARYESLMARHAPAVLADLQPGLTDAQIEALETKHAFKLTADLRALYRWRNGTAATSQLNAFPDHRFAPLEEAIAERDMVIQQVKAQTPQQQKIYATYAGHRDPWLTLLSDGAGDGYFFDPQRTEAAGSFFYCFNEDGSYVFYPAFRNYLAGVVDGHDTGVYKFGQHGAETVDFERAHAMSSKYGAENPR